MNEKSDEETRMAAKARVINAYINSGRSTSKYRLSSVWDPEDVWLGHVKKAEFGPLLDDTVGNDPVGSYLLEMRSSALSDESKKFGWYHAASDAELLLDEINLRQMPRSVYTALLNGTHEIFTRARAKANENKDSNLLRFLNQHPKPYKNLSSSPEI
jgi:hypothetical protein